MELEVVPEVLQELVFTFLLLGLVSWALRTPTPPTSTRPRGGLTGTWTATSTSLTTGPGNGPWRRRAATAATACGCRGLHPADGHPNSPSGLALAVRGDGSRTLAVRAEGSAIALRLGAAPPPSTRGPTPSTPPPAAATAAPPASPPPTAAPPVLGASPPLLGSDRWSLAAPFAQRLSPGGGLSAEARIQRAFDLGLADQKVVEGILEGKRGIQTMVDALPGLRNSWFVILRSGDGSSLTATCSATYASHVKRNGIFLAGTVSRAFASRAEATAYAIGAGRDSLPDLVA